MVYHILNGDSLAASFPSDIPQGKIVIIKEAFIEGPTTTNFGDAGYWLERSQYISDTYKEDPKMYLYNFLTNQLAALQQVTQDDNVYLWFEDDLFCQTNMWFSVYYITRFVQPQFFRIFPKEDNELWCGFGRAEKDQLVLLFDQKKLFSSKEIQLVNFLWEAYVHDDEENLKRLSTANSTCLRFLPEVIQAHLDRIPRSENPGRAKKVLREIMDSGVSSFYEIFSAFSLREGIYGYGDSQIKNMLKEMGVNF
jgi:hypothetical protein